MHTPLLSFPIFQTKKRILFFSDSMLKHQAGQKSKVAEKYVCSVRAFGGFNLNSLSDKLDLVKSGVQGYYHVSILFVGTNDLISDQFDMWKFISNLKAFLTKFHDKIKCKHVLVLGFMPRSYCNRKYCMTSDCKYLHRGAGKNFPVDLNRRVKKVNDAVGSFIRFDERFVNRFKFLNFFTEINSLGSINNSFGSFLSEDGLHLSDLGNELLDDWLFNFLQDMIW